MAKHLFDCPTGAAFAQGVGKQNLMTCFPLGNILGINMKDRSVVLFGLGNMYLLLTNKHNNYEYCLTDSDVANKVMRQLKEALENYHAALSK